MTLFNFLSNVPSAQFVTITTLTDVKLLKRGNPLKDAIVQKIAVRNCQFGYNYENAVNNRLERAGEERDFVAESLPWGEWLVPNKVITHNGNRYYRFYVAKNCPVTNYYYVNGMPATDEELEIIKQFLPKKADTSSTMDVMPYNVKEDNILSVKACGQFWEKPEIVEGIATMEPAFAYAA